MKKNLWLIIIAVAVFVLLLIGGTVLYGQLSDRFASELTVPPASAPISTDDSTPPSATGGFTAPDFSVLDSAGNEVRLSDFAGKPIVVNFWATWCPPCRAELPDFNSMYEKYGDRVNFLMVDLTDGDSETIGAVREFLAEEKYTFPVYYDTRSDAAYAYSVYSIPLTLMIDSRGNVVGNHVGAMSGQTLEGYLLRLLGEASD